MTRFNLRHRLRRTREIAQFVPISRDPLQPGNERGTSHKHLAAAPCAGATVAAGSARPCASVALIETPNTLVLVDDFDIDRICSIPSKAQAKLIVDPNTPLADPLALQGLESIPWRGTHILDTTRHIPLLELAQRGTFDMKPASHTPKPENSLGITTLERLDRHQKNIGSSGLSVGDI